MKIALLFLLFAFASTITSGQTSASLTSKYGEPFTAYLVRPTVMMTVKFDANGQVTQMLIAKKIEDNSNPTIAPVVVRELVEELVPVADRGAKILSSKPLPQGFGTEYGLEQYQYVSIRYETINIKGAPQCSGTAAILIKWKERPKPNLPILQPPIQQALAADSP